MMNEKSLKNLIPLNKRSKEEALEIQKKGGKASGKKATERKKLRDSLEYLLRFSMKDKRGRVMKSPITGEPMTVGETMTLAQIKKAINGDTRSFNSIADILGERSVSVKGEQKIQLTEKVDDKLSKVPDNLLEQVIEHMKTDDTE